MMNKTKQILSICLLSGVAAVVIAATPVGHQIKMKVMGRASVEDRVQQFGAAARNRWANRFADAGVAYPPSDVTLVAFKSEKVLQVYAENRWITSFPILGLSGKLGPKLRQGDRQVPEGIYGIESLNPNSRFHLALRVSYPNPDDLLRAPAGTDLGGDIMIHGGRSSVGCLAMGDPVSEDLFVLAADTGLEQISVLLAPVDFRVSTGVDLPTQPSWIEERYLALQERLRKLPTQ